MHRRGGGGKRIRMDEPPPEYENPMTPAVDPSDYGNYVQSNMYSESYNEQAGTSSSDGMFESPPTPGMCRVKSGSMRIANACYWCICYY